MNPELKEKPKDPNVIKDQNFKKEKTKDTLTNKDKLVLEKENMEEALQNPNTDQFLYPSLDDPNFNIKINNKKEFSNAKYDGTIANVEDRADELSKVDYELLPQQAFVKNFMSFQTPYNSLLLFHGLGSGKTCSAIGVCEEMRDYLRQMGISKQIIIVASPNVQDNFKLQLFDERKLKEQDGIWTMKSCLGNKLLKEINPTGMKGLKRDKVIQLVKNIIHSSYYFVGYTQFSNDIVRNQGTNISDGAKQQNLKNEYGGSLIVIDEVHNIRISDDNENKNVAKNLMYLVNVVNNMRLLLLSATPMFNSYKEIVWLLNLMNMNDRRGIVGVSDIFDAKTGELTKDGRKLLIRKATGYVSYVRGENPYTFPFRVYPNKFSPKNTIQSIKEYPEYNLNGRVIDDDKKISKLQLFLTHIGRVQEMGYSYIMNNLRAREARIRTTKTGQERLMPGFKEMKSFGYTDLMLPLQALNIIYPHDNLEELVAELEPIVYEKRLAEKEEEIDEISPLKTDTGDVIDEIDDVLLNGPEASVSNEPLSKAAKVVKTRKVKQPILEEIIVKPKPKAKTRKARNEVKVEGIHIIEGDTMSREQTLKNTNMPSEENLDLELDELEGGARGRPKKVIPGLNAESVIESVKPSANANANPNNINPKELTGSEGLRSLMNYEDSRTPAIKGSFEYKPGKPHIFEPGKIIEYSSKIANVCEYIYNTNTKRLSDGIILIYSSYIDAGLIPMALALEEMGFTRHNGKSLFKTPPSKSKVIKSAKYIMITGDPRLSPNNDADFKTITNDDNINGDKIKVVLISQAGSEGLDFKAIRQIHILDPWYNVNRLEQIIGRGVRNISHKDLPFRKRNVEIFLYGTWLTNTEEEAVDLYVYRISEIKAIKIGKVARLLKQVSVDCLINHDQSLLTADELKASNPNVEQLLSDHILLKNFEVGDIPGSATCDYGECEYTCLPLQDQKQKEKGEKGEEEEEELGKREKVVDGPFNLNTYNETFMLVNSDKIIQKIKALFSDPIDGRFFYKKKTLMKFIKQQKAYPTDQIYSALTYLINDNSAFIMDKYGRTGHLINIGDYYLFQPSELNYPNISVFDRSVPLNYKNDKIKFFNINPNVINPNVINPNVINPNVINPNVINPNVEVSVSVSHSPSLSIDPGKAVLDAMYKNYITTETVTNADKGSDDWYQYCGIVLQDMCRKQTSLITSKKERLKVFKSLIDTFLDKFVVEHIVDSLRFKDRIVLMNYLISDQDKEQDKEDFINLIRKYLKTKEYYAEKSKLTYVVVFDGPSKQYKDTVDEMGKSSGNLNIFILKAKKWVPAEPEDKRDLEQPIIDNYKLTKEAKNQMNGNVGFIGFETNHKDMVFKIKDTTNSRSYGYRCIQAGKGKKIIDTLEELESVNPLLARTDKDSKDSVFELCIRIELLLRIYQEEKMNKKIWFIDTERAIFNQFEKKEKEKEKE